MTTSRGDTRLKSQLHLVHTEILSVTSSIRKYTRNASSSSTFGFSSSAANSSSSVPHHPVALGSHSASLTGNAIAHARRRLVAFGADPIVGGAGNLVGGTESSDGADAGLKSVLTARAKEMEPTTVALDAKTPPQEKPTAFAENAESLEPSALLHSFTILRTQLKEHPDLDSFPLPLLLAPFLNVILSPRVSAPVTSAALQSVNRLLVYQVVPIPADIGGLEGPTSTAPPGLRLALVELAKAIAHCQFEASEPAVDELVLLRILAVMKELVCGTKHVGADGQGLSLADFLPDESICEMMETGLSMCCQNRLSDLLRKTAEQNLLPMVRHIFSRLPYIPLASDPAYEQGKEAPPDHLSLAAEDVDEVTSTADPDEKRMRRMTVPDPQGLQVNANDLGAEERPSTSDNGDGTPVSAALDASAATTMPSDAEAQIVATKQAATVTPFTLPAVKEVLRVIISLLDPQSATHNDSMRLLGLNLLTAAFETAGPEIARFPSLRAQVQDTGCKYLFQLARSESFATASYATRCVCTMFSGMKSDLKLQYELWLTYLLDRLSPTFPLSQEPWNESHHYIASAVPGRMMPARSGSADSARRPSTPEPAAPPAPPPPPMPRSSDRAPAHGDIRELSLEAMSLLLGAYKTPEGAQEDPLLELFLNFDCDVDCEDLFQKALQFFCRAVFATPPVAQPYSQHGGSLSPQQDGLQLFALDTVLSFVERLTARQETDRTSTQAAWPGSFPSQQSLETSRGRKGAILEGARRFNKKPKEGLQYFEQQGFISSQTDRDQKERDIAQFLMDCPRLDKKLLGDYLSRPDNEGVLAAFIQLFNFKGKPLSEAMREMLESFRLPGESQQINRIAEIFSKEYFATAAPRDVIKSSDAVYVLTYSVIMLNTDLHNAQNKRKMKVEDYRRNLRGVNEGTDFDPDYLGSIYESIRKREIVMPEEHLGQLGFDYAWKELLRKSRTSTKLQCPDTNQFDRAMFASSWRPLVACIAHAFSTFRDEHLLERAISGFRQCAILASKWGLDEVFDFMIEGLARNTGLLDESIGRSASAIGGNSNGGSSGMLTQSLHGSPNNAVVEVEGSKVVVSPLSVRFGADFKGQLAAVVLFAIANGNGQAIRTGWMPLFEIFKNLFAAGLLPAEIASMLDVTGDEGADTARHAEEQGRNVPIPLKPKRIMGLTQPDPRAQSSGLFSTLSSYLLSPYSGASEPAAPEVNAQEIESSLCSADCLASCRVEELYGQLLGLQSPESSSAAISALRQLADRLTLGQLAAAAANSQQEGSGPGRSTTPTQQQATGTASPAFPASYQLPYDPRAVFVLEMLTNLACAASDLGEDAWTEAAAHASSLLQSPKSFHPTLLERAVVCLLRLIDAAATRSADSADHSDFVTSSLDLIRSIPSDVRPALSPAIVGGLRHILSQPRQTAIALSPRDWEGLLSLVSDSLSTRTSKSIELSYALLSTISAGHICVGNYVSTVQLLRDIAQAADPEAMLQDVHKRERSGYRLTLTEKKELTEYVETCRSTGPLAIQKLEDIRSSIPEVLRTSPAGPVAAWSLCWLTLTSALASQSINAHRGTRQAALTSLQRVLFAQEVQIAEVPSAGLRQIFLTALFPVFDQLVDERVVLFSREQDPTAPGGLYETRTRACALLCRTFLHFVQPLSQLSNPADFQELWLQVLDLMNRFFKAGQSSTSGNGRANGKGKAGGLAGDAHLIEAVSENIKNVLLVMHSSDLLVPPPQSTSMSDARTPDQAAFWAVTFDRLDRFLPQLKKDLFPPEPAASTPALAASASEAEQNGETAAEAS